MKSNPWKDIGGSVVFQHEVVMALRLDVPSEINREFLGYQRSMGRVRSLSQKPKSLLITERSMLLLPVSVWALKRALK